MKKHIARKNRSIQALRKAIGRTQREFAALIGVSPDAVISWENGRNCLTHESAIRIYASTGATVESLLAGNGQLKNYKGDVYTKEDFDCARLNPEVIQNVLAESSSRTVELLLKAAIEPATGKLKSRFPAVFVSFELWAENARRDFRLGDEIDALLAEETCRLIGRNPDGGKANRYSIVQKICHLQQLAYQMGSEESKNTRQQNLA